MKKLLLRLVAALLLTSVSPRPRRLKNYPRAPDPHFIIAFGPGGGSDIIGRIVARRDADASSARRWWSRTSRAPAASSVMTWSRVATPDGYTLGIMTAGSDHRGRHHEEDALRHQHRLRAGRPDRDRQPDDRDAAGFPGQQRQGTDRLRQGQSRQGGVREPGLCRHPAFRRRNVQTDRQDRPAACAVSSTSPEAHQRRARQARRHHVRHGVGADRPGEVRPAQGAGGHRQGSLSRRCRMCRPAIESGRAARLRRHHLVRRIRAARYATGRHRQAEQDAQ